MTGQVKHVWVQTEHAVAEVLGATPSQARALVALLADAGVLGHGVVVVGAVAAARWGVELPEALVAMAEGRGVPEGISDYELRTAVEEGESDLEAVWLAAQRAGTQDSAPWRRLRSHLSETMVGDQWGDPDDMIAASAFSIDVAALLTG